MTNSQKLQIRMSETREAANVLDIKDEDRDRLLAELRELEKQFRSAVEAEAAETADAFNGSGPLALNSGSNRRVTHRADLGTMMGSILSPAEPDRGGSRSATRHGTWKGTRFPMSMLAEIRTVAAPTDGGGTQAVSGYVPFPASDCPSFCQYLPGQPCQPGRLFTLPLSPAL